MSIRTYTMADESGRLTGRVVTCEESDLAANTPPGCTAIAGAWDSMSYQVDLATGEVVDWQPPKPADTDLALHRWDESIRRWVADPTQKARALAERARLTRDIEALESRALRPLREAVLAAAAGQTVPAAARDALQALEAEVSSIRATMPPVPQDPTTRR